MRVADYIFKRLHDLGVEYTFGIPGDFVIPLYQAQRKSHIKSVVMTHEPSVGYAADVYARLKGLGVAMVTYGAGALNMVNAVAQAYAEESPLLVLSGAPEIRSRNPDALLHHRVKTFESQYNVFREITASATAVNNSATAAEDIDRVIETTMRVKRPGYIEIPRDMVHMRIGKPLRKISPRRRPSRAALTEAMKEIVGRINDAKSPVIYAGVEVYRFKLMSALIALSEKLNLPVITSLMGKTTFPENHPNFIGNYFGHLGPEVPRRYIEESDCVLALGTMVTDLNTGLFTSRIDIEKVIQAGSQETCVSHHCYSEVNLGDVVKNLLKSKDVKPRKPQKHERHKKEPAPTSRKITMAGIILELNEFLTKRNMVVCDVGDCLFGSLDLKAELFIAPGYYASMGFAVPGSIAAELAMPHRRPVVLVGDGAFQMTGVELSTTARLGLNPIVIIINNGCYATLKNIDPKGDCYDLPTWDYCAIARSIGACAERVQTMSEFHQALRTAKKSKGVYVIDAVMKEGDLSPTLSHMCSALRNQCESA